MLSLVSESQCLDLMADRPLRSKFSLKVGYEVFTGREAFVVGLLPTEREVRHFEMWFTFVMILKFRLSK